MKIYLASDHAGFEMKGAIKEYLMYLELGYEVVDMGADEFNEYDDYPDFIMPLARSIAEDSANKIESFGIIFGGSGQGEAMCANRVAGVRAAVFYGQEIPKDEVNMEGRQSVDSFEIVKLEREHNNANILSLGARFLTVDEAKFASELFLSTKFSGDERHVRRLSKF